MSNFEENSNEEYDEINIIEAAPLMKQLKIMLKITFLQRIRSSTLFLEIVLPIIFFFYVFLLQD